jgi:hypothetical protein
MSALAASVTVAALGWWWADPAGAHVLVFYSGREA